MARKRRKVKIILRKLKVEKAWGQAWYFDNLIELEERCRPKFFLDSCLHETLHLLLPDASEGKISNIAKVLTDVAWRLGYRRIYPEYKKMKT